MKLVDFRCKKCNKLLGKIAGMAEIKCPRCNSYNAIKSNKVTSNFVIAFPEKLKEEKK